MKKDATQVIDAAKSFVEALPKKDKLALMTFADKVDLAHDLTTLREWTLQAIVKYQTVGGTALWDALVESLRHLKKAEGQRAVVVLTDGRDENNAGTAAGSRRCIPTCSRR
jgi:Mg-chelatase subunit ChlD